MREHQPCSGACVPPAHLARQTVKRMPSDAILCGCHSACMQWIELCAGCCILLAGEDCEEHLTPNLGPAFSNRFRMFSSNDQSAFLLCTNCALLITFESLSAVSFETLSAVSALSRTENAICSWRSLTNSSLNLAIIFWTSGLSVVLFVLCRVRSDLSAS